MTELSLLLCAFGMSAERRGRELAVEIDRAAKLHDAQGIGQGIRHCYPKSGVSDMKAGESIIRSDWPKFDTDTAFCTEQ
jgi:hypothetical protein